MAGLVDLFKAAIGGTQTDTVDALRGAAAMAETFEAFTDRRAQAMLLNMLLPWVTMVAGYAARKWVTNRRKCQFDGGCDSMPVAECFACGRPVCLGHAFVGSDATIVCWPCMKNGASHAKPWRGGKVHEETWTPGPAPWEQQEAKPFDKNAWAYAVLGVKPESSDDEVKAAYKKACYDNHPDRASDPQEANARAEKFKMIQLAMQTIQAERNR